MKKIILILTLFIQATFTYGINNSATLDVTLENGESDYGYLKGEDVEMSGAYMPHLVLRDGRKALFSSKTDMAETFCLEVQGLDVFNPYRDIRMSNSEKRRYKTSFIGGDLLMVVGSRSEGYKIEKASRKDYLIMTIGCSTY